MAVQYQLFCMAFMKDAANKIMPPGLNDQQVNFIVIYEINNSFINIIVIDKMELRFQSHCSFLHLA